MKQSFTPFLLVFLMVACTVFLSSCGADGDGNGDPEPKDPCDNGPEEVEVNEFLHAYTDQNSGKITVVVSGGNGDLLYSIDGVNFSENSQFTDLGPGEYTITVMDDSSCTATLEYEVLEFPEVSFTDEVLPIINSSCQVSPCHGTDVTIPSWNGYGSIASNATRIRFMVTEKFMPPPSSGSSLSDLQITKIQNWVDVGAPNN